MVYSNTAVMRVSTAAVELKRVCIVSLVGGSILRETNDFFWNSRGGILKCYRRRTESTSMTFLSHVEAHEVYGVLVFTSSITKICISTDL